jgi:hypothetical protein
MDNFWRLENSPTAVGDLSTAGRPVRKSAPHSGESRLEAIRAGNGSPRSDIGSTPDQIRAIPSKIAIGRKPEKHGKMPKSRAVTLLFPTPAAKHLCFQIFTAKAMIGKELWTYGI